MNRIATLTALAAAAALTVSPTAHAADFVGNIGSQGNAPGQLNQPWGVATAPNGNVYVTEIGNARVSEFDSAGAFQRAFSGPSFGSGLAVSKDNVYVVDRDNEKVLRFNRTGTPVGSFGSSGVANGQFKSPRGIALSGNNVLVTSEFRFQRFTLDGTFVNGRGGSGTGDGQFNGISGIGTNDAGEIFVSETVNDRVQRFNADQSFNTKWGAPGDPLFTAPEALGVDSPTASVYVSDRIQQKVTRFGAGGAIRDVFGKPADEGGLQDPVGVAVDCRGNVFVADRATGRVAKYGTKPGVIAGNLLKNPGFDEGGGSCSTERATAGAGSGWSTSASASAVHYGAPGGFPTRQQGDAATAGDNFLSGGNAATTTVDQVVDVAGQALDIDDGRRLAKLSGLLGGFANQDDAADVEAVFRDGAGKAVGTPLKIGPVTAGDRGNATGLLARNASVTVPKGTRSIRVVVTMRALSGGFNDGYVDSLGLTLTPQQPPKPGTPGTPGTPGPGTGGGGDKTAPKITLRALSLGKVGRKGKLIVAVRCNERCGLSVKGVGLKRTLGKTGATPGSGERTLTIRLSPSALKALRKTVARGKRVKVAVTVQATDVSGNVSTTVQKVKVTG